jgi:PcfK-like protein
MKSTDSFEQIITAHLNLLAVRDELFAKTLKKENKSIEKCIDYILETVKKSGNNGFADEDIYDMAVHYFDEDDIKVVGTNKNVRIVVNHADVLSVEEIEAAKKKALKEVIDAEKERLTKKKTVKKSVENLENDIIKSELF